MLVVSSSLLIDQSASAATANPVAGQRFAVDPQNQGFSAANSLKNQGRWWEASKVERLANTPTAVWLGGWSNPWVTVTDRINSAKKTGTVPIFVAYNIPHRDCGQWSSGGAANANAYYGFIGAIDNAIGNNKAVVILEPDALAGLDCLPKWQQDERYGLLSWASQQLSNNTGTATYIDAGHSNWKTSAVMADRLKRAGVAKADGFAINVSSYYGNQPTTKFGTDLSNKLSGKHWVMDTSRNGKGVGSTWCNPGGRTVGTSPTSNTGVANLDAYLWVKNPGESDGYCNGGPAAGTFWSERAVALAG